MVYWDERQFGTVVGEISLADGDLAHVRFLGLSYQNKVSIGRATLENAGVNVAEDRYFGATVNITAETADELQPKDFEPFQNFKDRELG